MFAEPGETKKPAPEKKDTLEAKAESDDLESLEPSVGKSDDLDTLKTDLDEGEFVPARPESTEEIPRTAKKPSKPGSKDDPSTAKGPKEAPEPAVFEVGREERDLLSMCHQYSGADLR